MRKAMFRYVLLPSLCLVILGLALYFLYSIYSGLRGLQWHEPTTVPAAENKGQFIAINAGNQALKTLCVEFLEQRIVVKDLHGGHGVYRADVATDMSGEFELVVTMIYDDGEEIHYRTTMHRPPGRPVLQMSIKDKGKLSFH